MNNISILTIVLAFLCYIEVFSADTGKHLCALEWVDLSSGKQVPKTAVASEIDKLFIIRGRSETDNSWTVGYLDPILDRGFLPNIQNSSFSFNLTSFQVLQNIHGCMVNWVEPSHEDVDGLKSYAVPVDYDGAGNSILVGRTENIASSGAPNKLLGGHVVNSQRKIYIVESNVTRESQDYFVLISYTTTMELKLVDFTFSDDIFDGTAQIVGLEEIDNQSQATITQTVVHTSTITQRIKMTVAILSLNVATRVDASSGYNAFLFFDKTTTTTTTSSSVLKRDTIENEETSEVKLTRVVSVPPFTTLQCCSVLLTNDNFATNWTAMAVFKSPGMKASAILDWIKTQSDWNKLSFAILGDSVRTQIRGRIEGSFATGSKFLVTIQGCQETLSQIEAKRNSLFANANSTLGTRFEWKKYSDIVSSTIKKS